MVFQTGTVLGMWVDVVELQSFYNCPLGRITRSVLRGSIREAWPSLEGMSLLGIGYAIPYLEVFEGEVDQLIAVMPASQGLHHWPSGRSGKVVLSHEAGLPFQDCSLDRALLVHSLENTEHLRDMLEEVWRILKGEGRLLIITPSRRGIWAHVGTTPFGSRHHLSQNRIANLLEESSFQMIRTTRTLYTPPSHSKVVLRSAPVWESLGRRFLPPFGGILMVEAAKQIYAPTPRRKKLKPRLAKAHFPQPVPMP